jgi:ankyrin repeat protein
LKGLAMDARFHAAQAALAAGDVERLEALLKSDPGLATAQSTSDHPTILQCLVLTMPPVDTLERLIGLLADHGAELTDPLIAACGPGNVRAIATLLDLGANIEGNGRWSPLEEAAYFGQESCLSLLVERRAPVANIRTAAALGRLDLIKLWLDPTGPLTTAACEIAWPFSMPIPEELRQDRRQILGNAFVYAAMWGRLEVAEYLLNCGAQVNVIPVGFDYSGTPLHYAAFEGRREMVDWLLRHGADLSIRDTKISKLPEDWAEHSGHKDLAEQLQLVRRRAE